MTFKYNLSLPALGRNKLSRFKSWAKSHVPTLSYSAPLQVPTAAKTITVRLKSIEDLESLRSAFPTTLP